MDRFSLMDVIPMDGKTPLPVIKALNVFFFNIDIIIVSKEREGISLMAVMPIDRETLI